MSDKRQKQWHPRPGIEALINSKKSRLVAAERDFWRERRKLEEQNDSALDQLGLLKPRVGSSSLSSFIWGLRDGAVFIRHFDQSTPGNVKFEIDTCTLDDWANTKFVIPHNGKMISAYPALKGLMSLTLIDCVIGGLSFPYLAVTWMRYGDDKLPGGISDAVADYYLTVLGLQIHANPEQPEVSTKNHSDTLDELGRLADEFELLLTSCTREEELQVFLKQNPYILHQTAQAIPKQKLGEDFVTDFVLIEPTNNGPLYWMVEIERASHPILTREGCLSSATTQAIKQTREWDVWLESNKAYLKTRLPGFESPQYAVVIGRSNGLNDDAKAMIRSYNRMTPNLAIWSYDDVLTKLRSSINSMRQAVAPRNSNDTRAV